MKEKRLPKSVRKFLRREKARIRREVLDLEEQEKLISQLNEKFFKELKNKQTNTNINRAIAQNVLAPKK